MMIFSAKVYILLMHIVLVLQAYRLHLYATASACCEGIDFISQYSTQKFNPFGKSRYKIYFEYQVCTQCLCRGMSHNTQSRLDVMYFGLIIDILSWFYLFAFRLRL